MVSNPIPWEPVGTFGASSSALGMAFAFQCLVPAAGHIRVQDQPHPSAESGFSRAQLVQEVV